MALPPVYRIHPAIGIARLGDASPDDFFVGPERPNQSGAGVPGLGTMAPPYKAAGKIKRQAARFRVFEYLDKGGKYEVSREINLDEKDVVELAWTVHLANKKASFFQFKGLAGSSALPKSPKPVRRNASVVNRRKLEIDPLPRSIHGRKAAKVEFRKGSSGSSQETWPDPQTVNKIEYLGELRTDDKGRLIVIGAEGICSKQPAAAPIGDYANNDGWFDDTSDGPVTATLRLKKVDGTTAQVDVSGAWVMVAPPDFAPDCLPMVSLYQLLVDTALRGLPIPANEALYSTGELSRFPAMAKDLSAGGMSFASYKPSFDLDILPILRAANHSTWVFQQARHAHVTVGSQDPKAMWSMLSDPGASDALRKMLFGRLRQPGTAGASPQDMPRLLGDDPYDTYKTKFTGLWLTRTQYASMEQWSKSNFVKSLGSERLMVDGPSIPMSVTPHGLDRAALEYMSGGAFFPGIEVGWQVREAKLFKEPFRIKHGAVSVHGYDKPGTPIGPGYFSRQMALPWLADFLQCTAERTGALDWGWWPANRPDVAYASDAEARKRGTQVAWTRSQSPGPPGWGDVPDYDQMLAHWSKFGFVVAQVGGIFLETERGVLP